MLMDVNSLLYFNSVASLTLQVLKHDLAFSGFCDALFHVMGGLKFLVCNLVFDIAHFLISP